MNENSLREALQVGDIDYFCYEIVCSQLAACQDLRFKLYKLHRVCQKLNLLKYYQISK